MSRLQIRWPHVVAFLLGTLGIWGTAAATALQDGQQLSAAMLVMAISGTTGLVWALFAHTILPDFTGGGGDVGTTKKMLGGSGRPPAMPSDGTGHCRTRQPSFHLPAACVGFAAAIVVVWGIMLTQPGCAQLSAAFPEIDKVSQIVLADLKAGKGAEAIELDVAAEVAGKVGTAVVVLVNDAILALEDMGYIPPGIIPQAHEVLAIERPKIAALGIRR